VTVCDLPAEALVRFLGYAQFRGVAPVGIKTVASVGRSHHRTSGGIAANVGMSTLVAEVRAQKLVVKEVNLIVDLSDGRSITVPLAWYPRLFHGTPEERNNWRWIGDREGNSLARSGRRH
jgi:hypothetical protein